MSEMWRQNRPMPIPRGVATFNKHVTNHITGPFAAMLAGFAVIIHSGRVSKRTYRTPVNMFRRGGEHVFPLTYGPNVDWVKNVVAAGWCEVVTKRRTVRLTDPRLIVDRHRGCVPAPVRIPLRLFGVDRFLIMHAVTR
jgi:hypothetical protein